MVSYNRFGLSRNVPEEVKRKVRQRCGFGCVICGNPIISYEHFDPPFRDARSHSADGITLLCGSCHQKTTMGLINKGTVAKYNADPSGLREDVSFGIDDLVGSVPPIVLMGSNRFRCTGEVIRVADRTVLGFEVEIGARPAVLINMRICDRNGRTMFEIVRNEVSISKANWDVVWRGQSLTVRRANYKILLLLKFMMPNAIKISRLDLISSGVRLRVRNNGDVVATFASGMQGQGTEGMQLIRGCCVDGVPCGLVVTENGRVALAASSWEAIER